MKTIVKFVEREDLTPVQISLMWEIYKDYYNYSYSSFLERIETNTMFALYAKGEKVCGFTGLRINELEVNGSTHFLIYFGQTILPWGLKGKQLFPMTTGKLVLKFWKKILFCRTWVWFDALTFKAYWIPAKVVREFYPNRYEALPGCVSDLMRSVGKLYYGDNYCEKNHVVTKPKAFVKQAYRDIPQEFLKNPDIAFYAAKNPGYKEGHGLLTMVPLNLKNIAIVLGYLFKGGGAKHNGTKQDGRCNDKIYSNENSKNSLQKHQDTADTNLYSIQ